ncbi:MAG: sigma-54-dependent Fis family transcriptional regulator [Planctomycetes bacterium]|nr:sigma-54-dependent Fis family transcriptional regulator [Planctomycetota bacterium]
MVRRRVLIVDDEQGMLEVCQEALSRLKETDIHLESSGSRAAERLTSEPFDLVITDLRMPGLGGMDLIRRIHERDPGMAALVITAFPTVETAVECMKLGAADYIVKPFLPDALLAAAERLLEGKRLREENLVLRRHVERSYRFDEIIGTSAPMRQVFDMIGRVADVNVDVLVTGETGTGKELVARSIHKKSRRVDARFVPFDCGAIPEHLLESELFGHERGAFTGAVSRNPGLLELAEGGTFFLDEIAELPLPLQAKLLRTLQERRFRRVGGREEIELNVRIIAATNRDLASEVREKRFREDLYYRINVTSVHLPPLRERGEDIAVLTEYFLRSYGREFERPAMKIDPEVLEVFTRYPWPGNVRELQNVVKRAIALSRAPDLTLEAVPEELVARAEVSSATILDGFAHLRALRVAAFEKEYLITLLMKCRGEVSCAAREAKIPRATFYRLMRKHNLDADSFRTPTPPTP